MLGYLCKYTPVELFTNMGIEMKRLEPDVSAFHQADAHMHPNVCSYAKAVFEEATSLFSSGSDSDPLEGIIFTTCCDSVRRLYDAIKREYPDKFFYLLDLPRKYSAESAALYASQIQSLAEAYEEFSSKKFHHNFLDNAFEDSQNKAYSDINLPSIKSDDAVKNQADEKSHVKTYSDETSNDKSLLQIGILGARCNPQIREMLHRPDVSIAFDMTCTGITRDFTDSFGSEGIAFSTLDRYAAALLKQFPCMRMQEADTRLKNLLSQNDFDGIIYHTVKFCDNYSYEYADIHSNSQLPILFLETDCTSGSAGQMRTRVEAFLEELSTMKTLKARSVTQNNLQAPSTSDICMRYVLGIDSGSTSTNAVLLDENSNMIASHVVRTGAKAIDSATRIREEILSQSGISPDQIVLTVATGYGRVNIPYADKDITEISCHAKGAHFLNPNVRTILDIGGQDSKAIRLNEKGDIIDFVMNDKCAAGTGRFLEAMARTLEIDIKDLGPISLHSKEAVEISSMCTVFAESEVISYIASNKEKGDIARGVHIAIANKAMSLLRKVGLEPAYMMTGGVAKNPGVVNALEEMLGEKLMLPGDPEIVGALGAALYGVEALTPRGAFFTL